MDAHQRFYKKYQAKLEELDREVTAAMLEKEQLVASNRVLRQKNNELVEAARAKAAKVETELQFKLQQKREKLEDGIKVLVNEEITLGKRLAATNIELANLGETRDEVLTSIDSAKSELKEINSKVLDTNHRGEAATAEVAQLKQHIDELRGDLAGMEALVSDSEKQHEAIGQEVAALESTKRELINQSESKKDQLTKEILSLDAQLTKKLEMLRTISAKDKAMREELVKKQVELEKREEVIRRRESIVLTNEQKVRDNLNMLQL